jgi:hypothetical protein
VRAVVPGDRVYYRGDPLRVFSAALTAHPVDPTQDTVELVFGSGAWWEPRVTLPAESLVYRAQEGVVLAAEAGFTAVATITPPTDPPLYSATRVPIPVEIVAPGSVALAMTDVETTALDVYPGAWSWDLFAQTAAWGWSRLTEGTLTVIKGSGRAAVIG